MVTISRRPVGSGWLARWAGVEAKL
jgi:hypothetical protein